MKKDKRLLGDLISRHWESFLSWKEWAFKWQRAQSSDQRNRHDLCWRWLSKWPYLFYPSLLKWYAKDIRVQWPRIRCYCDQYSCCCCNNCSNNILCKKKRKRNKVWKSDTDYEIWEINSLIKRNFLFLSYI